MIKLGSKVRDSVSGFEGVAIARVEYLNGCTQYGVLPKIPADGKMPDAVYIDYQRLEVTEPALKVVASDTGGEMRDTPSGEYRG